MFKWESTSFLISSLLMLFSELLSPGLGSLAPLPTLPFSLSPPFPYLTLADVLGFFLGGDGVTAKAAADVDADARVLMDAAATAALVDLLVCMLIKQQAFLTIDSRAPFHRTLAFL